jgi:cob(I)alamin adenosyltransferase
MKIYTRTGDTGTTSLFGGERVTKDHARLEAYGTLDELNSILGLLRLHTANMTVEPSTWDQIQSDIFALCAHLATPPEQEARLDAKMHRPMWAIELMEQDINRLCAIAPELKSFVLPGGCQAAAYAHLARTVCRRAERRVVTLAAIAPVPTEQLVYLNRLSDWLFALARAENAAAGLADTAWKG